MKFCHVLLSLANSADRPEFRAAQPSSSTTPAGAPVLSFLAGRCTPRGHWGGRPHSSHLTTWHTRRQQAAGIRSSTSGVKKAIKHVQPGRGPGTRASHKTPRHPSGAATGRSARARATGGASTPRRAAGRRRPAARSASHRRWDASASYGDPGSCALPKGRTGAAPVQLPPRVVAAVHAHRQRGWASIWRQGGERPATRCSSLPAAAPAGPEQACMHRTHTLPPPPHGRWGSCGRAHACRAHAPGSLLRPASAGLIRAVFGQRRGPTRSLNRRRRLNRPWPRQWFGGGAHLLAPTSHAGRGSIRRGWGRDCNAAGHARPTPLRLVLHRGHLLSSCARAPCEP